MVKRKQEISSQLSATNIKNELQTKLEVELELIELKTLTIKYYLVAARIYLRFTLLN